MLSCEVDECKPLVRGIGADKFPRGMTQLIEEWPAGGSVGDALERLRRGDPVPLVRLLIQSKHTVLLLNLCSLCRHPESL
jgi:hypothetical protein